MLWKFATLMHQKAQIKCKIKFDEAKRENAQFQEVPRLFCDISKLSLWKDVGLILSRGWRVARSASLFLPPVQQIMNSENSSWLAKHGRHISRSRKFQFKRDFENSNINYDGPHKIPSIICIVIYIAGIFYFLCNCKDDFLSMQ